AERTAGERAATKVAEVVEGIRFQFVHPVLRPLVITGSVMNLANTAYFAVFVLWVVGQGSRVGLAPEQFPLLLAVLAVGAVIGSVVAERLVAGLPEVGLLMGCWFLNTALLLVAVLVPQWWAIAAAFLAVGLTNMVGNVISRSMRQRLVPAD